MSAILLLPKFLIRALVACSFLLVPALHAAAAAESPSEAECIAFGQKIAALLDSGKTQEAVDLLDRARLLARITDGLGLNQEMELSFRQGVLKNLSTGLVRQFNGFTDARFLRLQSLGGETRALVRLISEEGAVSYIAFICARDREGATRWVDAYLYIAGATFSEAMRNTALPMVAEMKKGVMEKITTKQDAFAANMGKIQQATLALQKGAHAEALAICDKMPREVQLNRVVLVLRLRAAQPLEELKYLAVIKDWEAAFPNDSTLDFISIDGDIMRKDYPAALKHIAAFGKQIGGDAYLDYLSSNVLLMAEKFDEARAVARKALKDEPLLFGTYDTLLTVSLKTKNYAETISILEEFGARFPTADIKKDMVSGDEYAAFRKSPEYLAWTKSKPAEAKAPSAK
jgi:hypothetical protein